GSLQQAAAPAGHGRAGRRGRSSGTLLRRATPVGGAGPHPFLAALLAVAPHSAVGCPAGPRRPAHRDGALLLACSASKGCFSPRLRFGLRRNWSCPRRFVIRRTSPSGSNWTTTSGRAA